MVSSPLNGAHIIRARRWAPTPLPRLNGRNVSRSKRLDRFRTCERYRCSAPKWEEYPTTPVFKSGRQRTCGIRNLEEGKDDGDRWAFSCFSAWRTPGRIIGNANVTIYGESYRFVGERGHYGDE